MGMRNGKLSSVGVLNGRGSMPWTGKDEMEKSSSAGERSDFFATT